MTIADLMPEPKDELDALKQANSGERALKLQSQGYEFIEVGDMVFVVNTPRGEMYCLNVRRWDCDCKAREEDGYCKHLLQAAHLCGVWRVRK